MGAAPIFLQYDRTVGSKLFGVNEPLGTYHKDCVEYHISPHIAMKTIPTAD